MTARADGPFRIVLALAALAALTGCEAPQQRAREEATHRWNQARAQVKAKLAADQFAAGDIAAAAADLAQADRLDPDNPALVPLRARIRLAEGKIGAAAELLEQTQLEGSPQAEVEYLLGVTRQQQQRWDEALAAYQRAAELNPEEVAYVVAVAQVHLQLGQAQQAVSTLQQAAPRFGWTNAYQAVLAECWEQLGDWSAAASAWQRVASAPGAEGDIRERLAVALYRACRYAEAIPAFQGLLHEAGRDSSELPRLLLAECYLGDGQPALAREQTQSVLQRERDNVRALRLLARCFAAAGEYAAALRVTQQALGVNPSDVGTLELAAVLAARAGDSRLAADTAAHLLQLDALNPVALRLVQQAPGGNLSPQR